MRRLRFRIRTLMIVLAVLAGSRTRPRLRSVAAPSTRPGPFSATPHRPEQIDTHISLSFAASRLRVSLSLLVITHFKHKSPLSMSSRLSSSFLLRLFPVRAFPSLRFITHFKHKSPPSGSAPHGDQLSFWAFSTSAPLHEPLNGISRFWECEALSRDIKFRAK